MTSPVDWLDIFKRTGALQEGHFILSSGRHSPAYFQCARVLQYPEYLEQIAGEIAARFVSVELDFLISPAIGGITLGTEVGRQLGVRTLFAEREGGRMVLRRGFSLTPGETGLVVEDVITTGGSVREVMRLVESLQGRIAGVGTVVDRSNGTVHLHEHQFSLISLPVVSYAPDDLPPELAQLPPEKPGSRGTIS